MLQQACPCRWHAWPASNPISHWGQAPNATSQMSSWSSIPAVVGSGTSVGSALSWVRHLSGVSSTSLLSPCLEIFVRQVQHGVAVHISLRRPNRDVAILLDACVDDLPLRACTNIPAHTRQGVRHNHRAPPGLEHWWCWRIAAHVGMTRSAPTSCRHVAAVQARMPPGPATVQ